MSLFSLKFLCLLRVASVVCGVSRASSIMMSSITSMGSGSNVLASASANLCSTLFENAAKSSAVFGVQPLVLANRCMALHFSVFKLKVEV